MLGKKELTKKTIEAVVSLDEVPATPLEETVKGRAELE